MQDLESSSATPEPEPARRRDYPRTPTGWAEYGRRRVAGFTTHVAYRLPGGGSLVWSSRRHRKHASLLSRGEVVGALWAPRKVAYWIAVLFSIGATCFLVAPSPLFAAVASATTANVVLFIGSLFFTSAAALQFLETINTDAGPARTGARRRIRWFAFQPHRIDWWATAVQLLGTVLFNVTTVNTLVFTHSPATAQEAAVWTPDLAGSICFLVASVATAVEVGWRTREVGWWISLMNLAGSLAFGVAAVAAYIVPSTGQPLNLRWDNGATMVGALGFLAGALLLLPEAAGRTRMPQLPLSRFGRFTPPH